MEIMHRRLVVPPLFDLTPLHHILHEICEGRGAEKGTIRSRQCRRETII